MNNWIKTTGNEELRINNTMYPMGNGQWEIDDEKQTMENRQQKTGN